MSEDIMTGCPACGHPYRLFLSKRRRGEIEGLKQSELIELEKRDAELEIEEHAEHAKRMAEAIGGTYVDLRHTSIVICHCGTIIDFEQGVKEGKLKEYTDMVDQWCEICGERCDSECDICGIPVCEKCGAVTPDSPILWCPECREKELWG